MRRKRPWLGFVEFVSELIETLGIRQAIAPTDIAAEQRTQQIFQRPWRRRNKTVLGDDSRALIRNRQLLAVGEHAKSFALKHFTEGVA